VSKKSLVFASFALAVWAGVAQGAVVCSAQRLVPQSGSDYINRCFTLNLQIKLDFDHQRFDYSGGYIRKRCGGWPPYSPDVSGTIQPVNATRFVLTGSDGVSPDDFTAEVHLADDVLQLAVGDATYNLRCR